MGFFTDIVSVIISNVPIERLFGKPPRLKYLEELRDQLPTAEEQKPAKTPQLTPSAKAAISAEQRLETATKDELEFYSLFQLQSNLQGLEAHLPLAGIGKSQCSCLGKHAVDTYLYAKENINYSGNPSLYRQLSEWGQILDQLQPDAGLKLGTMTKEDYDRFAKEAREFRKQIQEDRYQLAQRLMARTTPMDLADWTKRLKQRKMEEPTEITAVETADAASEEIQELAEMLKAEGKEEAERYAEMVGDKVKQKIKEKLGKEA